MEKNIKTTPILLLLFFFIFFSCSNVVIRKNYRYVKNSNTVCKVSYRRSVDFDDSTAVLRGFVRYKGGTFTFYCSESDVLEFLRQEACRVNANVVVIVSDKRPNFINHCYRCSAYLYHTDNVKYQVNDDYYSPERIRYRMHKDKGKTIKKNFRFQIGMH